MRLFRIAFSEMRSTQPAPNSDVVLTSSKTTGSKSGITVGTPQPLAGAGSVRPLMIGYSLRTVASLSWQDGSTAKLWTTPARTSGAAAVGMTSKGRTLCELAPVPPTPPWLWQATHDLAL